MKMSSNLSHAIGNFVKALYWLRYDHLNKIFKSQKITICYTIDLADEFDFVTQLRNPNNKASDLLRNHLLEESII